MSEHITSSGVPGTSIPGQCGYCGNWHFGICPRILSIEYYQNGTIKRVELLYDIWPSSPPPPGRARAMSDRDREQVSIGEAFDTGSHIIVAVSVGYDLDESHNCDAMGCGQWHVLYRFPKPPAEREGG